MTNRSLIQEQLIMFVTFWNASNTVVLMAKDKEAWSLIGNGELVSVKAVALVVLSFDNNRTFCLEECMFIRFGLKKKLISVSCLIKHGLIVQFNFSVSIRNNAADGLMNGLYNYLNTGTR